MPKQKGMRQRTKAALGNKWTLKDDLKWLSHIRYRKAKLFPRRTITIQALLNDPDFDLLMFDRDGRIYLAQQLASHPLFESTDFPIIYANDDDLRFTERQWLAWQLYWCARQQDVELIIF